jgi:hypothetical protein
VQAPGPYGGAYLLAVALPREGATLQALDSFLRETWYTDMDFMTSRPRDPDRRHLSMFLAPPPGAELDPAVEEGSTAASSPTRRRRSARRPGWAA